MEFVKLDGEIKKKKNLATWVTYSCYDHLDDKKWLAFQEENIYC